MGPTGVWPRAQWIDAAADRFELAVCMLVEQDMVDSQRQSVTSRGRSPMPFQVFIAKYSYDPEQYSPNENPDVELALTAGDYLFVYGDMDEVRRNFCTVYTGPRKSWIFSMHGKSLRKFLKVIESVRESPINVLFKYIGCQ